MQARESRSYSLHPRLSVPARIVRALSLLAVSSLIFLNGKDLANYPVFLLLFCVSTASGIIVGRTRLRSWTLSLLAFVLPFTMRLLFFSGVRLLFAITGKADLDMAYPFFDETFLPFLPLFAWSFITAALAERMPWSIVMEMGLDLLLLALATWTQAGGKVTLYPHPSYLALAGVLVLFLSLGTLAIGEKPRKSSLSRKIASLSFVVLVVLFLAWLLGRYSESAVAAGGGLLKPTLFRFDFSQILSLESKISLGDDLVLLMRKDSIDENIYLRRSVLSRFDASKGTFSPDSGNTLSDADVPVELPDTAQVLPDPGWQGRVELAQEYYLLELDPGTLIAMNAPVSIIPKRFSGPSSFSSVYGVKSRVPGTELRELLQDYDPRDGVAGIDAADIHTDYANDERIAALAREITLDIPGYYHKVFAVEQYFRDNYSYSLSPGKAPDGNQLAWFLYQSKKGYCSYFAFSMTLALRSLGIPSRIAVGFYVDPSTEALGFYPVKSNMAHAWVEVWFGPYGWIEFDPTSQNLAPGEKMEVSNGIDPQLFERLLREILAMLSVDVPDTAGAASPGNFSAFLEQASRFTRKYWAFLLFALYALSRALALLISFLRLRCARGRRIGVRFWSSLVRACEQAGYTRGTKESSVEFAVRVETQSSVPLEGLAHAYERSSFAPAWSQAEGSQFKESARAAIKAIRKRTPLFFKLTRLLGIRRRPGALP